MANRTDLIEETYWLELELQIRRNESQAGDLKDRLFFERLKFSSYIFILVCISCIAFFIVRLVFVGELIDTLNHHATLVNIGILLVLLGIFEVASLLLGSLSILIRIERMLKKQTSAIENAKSALSEQFGST